MQAVRHKAAGNLLSQHTTDRIQVERVGELMAKCTQAFLIGPLTSEERAIHKGLQTGTQRIETDRDNKDQPADQVWIRIRHADRKEKSYPSHEQSIGRDHENCQRRINHSLTHPIIGAQETETEDHISIDQREKDEGDKEIRIKRQRVRYSFNGSSP